MDEIEREKYFTLLANHERLRQIMGSAIVCGTSVRGGVKHQRLRFVAEQVREIERLLDVKI